MQLSQGSGGGSTEDRCAQLQVKMKKNLTNTSCILPRASHGERDPTPAQGSSFTTSTTQYSTTNNISTHLCNLLKKLIHLQTFRRNGSFYQCNKTSGRKFLSTFNEATFDQYWSFPSASFRSLQKLAHCIKPN